MNIGECTTTPFTSSLKRFWCFSNLFWMSSKSRSIIFLYSCVTNFSQNSCSTLMRALLLNLRLRLSSSFIIVSRMFSLFSFNSSIYITKAFIFGINCSFIFSIDSISEKTLKRLKRSLKSESSAFVSLRLLMSSATSINLVFIDLALASSYCIVAVCSMILL